MNYSKPVQVVQGGHKLPNEGAGGRFSETFLLEVAPDMREQLSTFCNFCDKAVEVVGLHCLVETDDIWVAQPSHELCFSKEIFLDIIFFDFVCFNNFYCNLQQQEQK